MSQSGQHHPKADNGGQRPTQPKKADHKPEVDKGSTKAAIDAGKAGGAGGKKDAKK